MIAFEIDHAGLDRKLDHIEVIKASVQNALRAGMRDALQALGEYEAANSPASGILKLILLRGGNVSDNGAFVNGIYRPKSKGKQPHYWFEYGTKVPAVAKQRPMAMKIGSEVVFRMRHAAFTTPARPFFYQNFEVFKPEFFAIMRARFDEAVAESTK